MRGQIDNIIVRKVSAGEIVDDHGGWVPTIIDTLVKGSFHHTLMYDRNPEIGGQYGERIVSIARLPVDTDVSQGDKLVIEGKNPTVDGIYEVDAVLYTRPHLRVQTRRISV
jgi:hypothetical protein